MLSRILDYFFPSSKKDNLERWYVLKIGHYALFIHRALRTDDPDVFHTHPWNGLSFIIGGYREEVLEFELDGGEEYVDTKTQSRRFINYVRAKTPHRVELTNGPVWSIFIHGPRCNQWGVFNRKGELVEEEPWRGISPARKNYDKDKG